MTTTDSSASPPETTPVRYAVERQREIARILAADGRVEVTNLATTLGVTPETVRKDLTRLEHAGTLRRVHGGAVPAESQPFEPEVAARTSNDAEKRHIATRALDELPAQGSVLLDAGSTVTRLAESFPSDRELTTVTNTLSIARLLLSRPMATVMIIGGRIRGRTDAAVDDWALEILRRTAVDVAFVGTNAMSLEQGLSTPDPAEASVKRAMLACARRVVLLADHSKFGRTSLCGYGTLDDVDLLITDSGMPEEHRRQLEDFGLPVVLA